MGEKKVISRSFFILSIFVALLAVCCSWFFFLKPSRDISFLNELICVASPFFQRAINLSDSNEILRYREQHNFAAALFPIDSQAAAGVQFQDYILPVSFQAPPSSFGHQPQHNFTVRVYQPIMSSSKLKAESSSSAFPPLRPLVLYFHGGGFMTGSRLVVHAPLLRLAHITGCVIGSFFSLALYCSWLRFIIFPFFCSFC
jgi:acetyl esterase/lipase